MISFRTTRPTANLAPRDDTQASHGKRTQVAQACTQCRQAKAKCDGVRPRCGNCVAKGKPCGYIGDAGQSRQAAMMARLETLERLFRRLQSQPDDEAQRTYAQIRAVDECKFVSGTITDPGSDSSDTSTTACSPGRRLDGLSDAASQSPQMCSWLPSGPDGSQSPANALVVAKIALPARLTVARMTDAFFRHSLEPFRVFSRDDIANFIGAVYSDVDEARPAAAATIACLAAVAAVGAGYLDGSSKRQSVFPLYQVARYYFESVVDEAPLDAIKCCVLLALCNMMAKSTVAIDYIECGLNMSRRQGLHAPGPRDATLAMPRWADYRRAWRALLCLSSWIPFVTRFSEDHADTHTLFDAGIGLILGDADSLQMEMAKISLLRADLRVRLTIGVIDGQALESANKDLQTWYSGIPEGMHLSRLQEPGPEDGLWTSTCYTHLLHLDAVMLLSQRAILQFVRTQGYGRRNKLPPTPLDQALVNQANQGVIAASHSSRLLRMLQEAGHALALSLLIMNQTYTSCAFSLLSALQKQLHNFNEADWADDVENAAVCLSILATCSVNDVLAQRLHDQLNAMYALASKGSPPSSSPEPGGKEATASWGSGLYIFTTPNDAPSDRMKMATELLRLLCRRFVEASGRKTRNNMALDPISSVEPTEELTPTPDPKLIRSGVGAEAGAQGLGVYAALPGGTPGARHERWTQ